MPECSSRSCRRRDCHCTVGAGEPDAAAVNATAWPATAVTLAGLVVTAGATATVSVAAAEDVEPKELVNVMRYS